MREHKVLGFIHEQNEQLDSVVLQPLSHPTRDDIDADFCELYRLPSRQLRLNEFIQRFGEDLEFCERVNFVKVLLSHAADLHDLGVAHRDISDHTIWLERPSKISISGFLTAYFPELGTVGSLRDQLRASKTILPEDSEIGQGEASDPFRRDVYLLAVVIHHILFLQAPKQEDSLFVWNSPTDFEVDPQLSTWFETALDLIPAGRFSDARTMLNSFNTLSLGYPEKTGIDLRRFEPYRSELIPMVIYPIEENIKQGISHLYKSTFSGESVSVKVWYGRKPDIKRPEEALQLQNFLDKARLIKSQPCSSLAEVIDFGISDAGTYLVQKWLNGEFLKLVNKEVSLKSGEDGEKIDTLPVSEKTIVQSGLWLAPQLSLWARTRGAREFVQKIDRLLDSRNKKKSNPVGTYVMISGRNNAAKDRAFKYRDQFQYLFNLDICLMDGKLELLLIPGLIVCVLFHFHLEHQPVSIPIGFISSEVEHLKIASSLISESTRSKQIFSSMYDSENVPVAYQGLQNLLDIISTE